MINANDIIFIGFCQDKGISKYWIYMWVPGSK
jgi:hypothetical protein